MKIAEWPVADRPREKLLRKGPASLTDAELLAVFLQSGTVGHSAVDLGHELLHRYKSLRRLMEAGQDELCSIRGLGPAKYVCIRAALELGRRYLQEEIWRAPPLDNPQATRAFLSLRLRPYQHEVFACIFLDNRHRPLAFEELFSGTIDSANVYPREVLKRCLYHNAAAVIFAHNHPSGIAEPSQADLDITRQLKRALGLVDIRLLDHFIVGDNLVTSLAERGQV